MKYSTIALLACLSGSALGFSNNNRAFSSTLKKAGGIDRPNLFDNRTPFFLYDATSVPATSSSDDGGEVEESVSTPTGTSDQDAYAKKIGFFTTEATGEPLPERAVSSVPDDLVGSDASEAISDTSIEADIPTSEVTSEEVTAEATPEISSVDSDETADEIPETETAQKDLTFAVEETSHSDDEEPQTEAPPQATSEDSEQVDVVTESKTIDLASGSVEKSVVEDLNAIETPADEELEPTQATAEESEEVQDGSKTVEKDGEDTERMSIKEILDVASEMEILTDKIDGQSEAKSIQPTPAPVKKPYVKTENDEKIETFVKALGEVTKDTTGLLLKGLWGGLRRTAADALTKSMPDEERSTLLARMQSQAQKSDAEEDNEEETKADDDNDDDEEERGSVAEEIAGAQAAQARLSEEKWEEEKEKLIQQMQEAANERVESQLAIQKERLDQEMATFMEEMESSQVQLKEEKQVLAEKLASQLAQEEQVASQKEAREEIGQIMDMGQQDLAALKELLDKRDQQKQELVNLENDLRGRLEEIERQKELVAKGDQELLDLRESSPQGEETPQEQTPVEVHPVLGSLVSDLGYKRIYLAPSGKLGTIPIWKKQRIYRHDRARIMAKDKVKAMQLGFPGAVCLHEDAAGNLSVLDGQHRIGMMQMLRELKKEDDSLAGTDQYFNDILVEVYPTPPEGYKDDEEHAEAVFLEINKAEPVKLVDMPGVASTKDRKIITNAVSRLQEQFPDMFSPSQACRVPNVNVDNMRNNIFGASVVKRHKIKSAKQLYDWLLVQNAALGASYECDDSRKEGISEKAWKKASENSFYLGLESGWLYK